MSKYRHKKEKKVRAEKILSHLSLFSLSLCHSLALFHLLLLHVSEMKEREWVRERERERGERREEREIKREIERQRRERERERDG